MISQTFYFLKAKGRGELKPESRTISTPSPWQGEGWDGGPNSAQSTP